MIAFIPKQFSPRNLLPILLSKESNDGISFEVQPVTFMSDLGGGQRR